MQGPAPLLRVLQNHYEPLRRFVERRMRSPETAADIVQETYVKVAMLDEATVVRNPLAFLYRIAGNLSLDWLREREVRERHFESGELPEVADGAPDSEAHIAGHQRLQILADAVAELPPRCSEVFRLRKLEHMEPQQIADQLGISRNMVEKHLRKALTHCQARLDEAGA
ncbi:RNA polymerase sigma factor [Luteibacter aegosomatissinici]|uniref:RNA polymerase sigma factor n=1 Tax=Luteibacter aegosomatissinici TaxID=2911539 RepID=UPI001FFC03F4|nr:RNA polymerase sigma factor [Luteibacter aegosomatissinici]UPG95434.1 RNA polymerase sigma factor [Luteibacter aegosomatissinici]